MAIECKPALAVSEKAAAFFEKMYKMKGFRGGRRWEDVMPSGTCTVPKDLRKNVSDYPRKPTRELRERTTTDE